MLLIPAFFVFSVLFLNVTLSAFFVVTVLGNVGAMLVLSGASALFVVTILRTKLIALRTTKADQPKGGDPNEKVAVT